MHPPLLLRGDEVAVSSRRGVELGSTTTWRRTGQSTNFTVIPHSPDAHTLEPLLPLPKDTLPLALSRDRRHLAVRVDARRMQVWDLVEVRNQLRAIGLDWVFGRQEDQTARQ